MGKGWTMDILDKVRILANAAKYDVSCSSSGSDRKNSKGGIGNAAAAGICHSWSEDGRCISLLKILMTNICAYDCIYCVNKVSNDVERAFLTPEEIAEITINFYRRNYIEGLFLSSAVIGSPDQTTELMLRALHLLRHEHSFNGYIHVKLIPGTDPKLIARIGLLADRVSVNVELPSSESLKILAPQKSKDAILRPMAFITSQIAESKENKISCRNHANFVPAGQTTQLMVGASPERDLRILQLSENLYKTFKLKRVYFSSYVPVINHPNLPSLLSTPPLLREHRLYQADWLLRFYGFSASEILNEQYPDLSLDFDPKTEWALRNLHLFPIEINRANYETLIRIPGIGNLSARKILSARRAAQVDFDLLKKLGVVLKRARYFITCKGKYYGGIDLVADRVRSQMLLDNGKAGANQWEQVSILQMAAWQNNRLQSQEGSRAGLRL